MKWNELKFKDLKKIYGNFYILPGPANNIFYCSQWKGAKPTIMEPCSLKSMLIELSDKVPFGNNYTSVAEGLNLNPSLLAEAKLLDTEQYNTWKSK